MRGFEPGTYNIARRGIGIRVEAVVVNKVRTCTRPGRGRPEIMVQRAYMFSLKEETSMLLTRCQESLAESTKPRAGRDRRGRPPLCLFVVAMLLLMMDSLTTRPMMLHTPSTVAATRRSTPWIISSCCDDNRADAQLMMLWHTT